MLNDVTCCTCASILNVEPPSYTRTRSFRPVEDKSGGDEKATTSTSSHDSTLCAASKASRQLPCCNRVICTSCITKNSRFNSYCPFCQITSQPSPLPQGLRDPPPYNSQPPSPKRPHVQPSARPQADNSFDEQPPAYTSLTSAQPTQHQAEDVTHHLRQTDTIQSLSLAYNVPRQIIRSHNSLFSDHLLSARHALKIPTSHYTGASLSPTPVDSELEAERKASIRKFMVGAKCADYNVAELYLRQAKGDVDIALECWREDEKWERENPFEKAKIGRRRNVQAKSQGRRNGP